MTVFEFKSATLRNGMRLDYKAQMIDLVRNVPSNDAQGAQKRGFSDADIDSAEALATKIDDANGSVELTPAEVMLLVEKVSNVQWPFSDPAFRDFSAAIKLLREQ